MSIGAWIIVGVGVWVFSLLAWALCCVAARGDDTEERAGIARRS